MDKKLPIILFSVIAAATAAQGQSHWKNPDFKRDIYIRAEELKQSVIFLSDSLSQGRSPGSAGHDRAARYIEERFKDMRLVPLGENFIQRFSSPRVSGCNIVAFAAGENSYEERKKYVIVGSHYDGLGILDGKLYPGADANASGVAAMLGTARMFQRQRYLYNYPGSVIFVAFDAYGYGMEGSRAFVDALKNGEFTDPVNGMAIGIKDIELMIDIDQIGSTLSPVDKSRKDFVIAIGEDSLPKEKQGNVNRCNWFYYCDLDLHFDYYGSSKFTKLFYRLGDRRNFIDENVPTVYFTSGITSVTNTSKDCSDTLDYEILKRRTILIFRFLEKSL